MDSPPAHGTHPPLPFPYHFWSPEIYRQFSTLWEKTPRDFMEDAFLRRNRRYSLTFLALIYLSEGQPVFRCPIARIVAVAHMSRRSVQLALAELEQDGHVERMLIKRRGSLWLWSKFTLPHLQSDFSKGSATGCAR